MDQPTIVLDKNKTKIELLPLYDIHYGSAECNEELLKKGIEYIKNHHNCFTFIGGDVIESAIYGSVGSVHAQKHQINEQIENICRMLQPIKNKIMFAICGNHEYRVEKATGLNIVKIMSEMLGIPYCGWESYFVIKFKKNMFCKGYAHHGTGGGGTAGAKMNSLDRLHNRAPLSNLIIAGHTHFASNMVKQIRFVDNRGKMQNYCQYFVSCGTAHESDGYASMKGFAPLQTSMSLIKIGINKTDFEMEVKNLTL
jgi:hypothetical protein